MPRTLVKRELTLATYFLKQDWLLKEFLSSLPSGSFTSNIFSLSFPLILLSCVCTLNYSVTLPVSLPLSPAAVPFVALLHVHRYSISVLIILCPEVHTSQFTRVMITLPFTSFLFLHVFMEFLPQPRLTDHMSNQHSACNIRVSGTYCSWFNLWKIKSLFVSSISSSTVLAAHFQPRHPILPW